MRDAMRRRKLPLELHPDREHVHLAVREHLLELHAIGRMQRDGGLRRRGQSIDPSTWLSRSLRRLAARAARAPSSPGTSRRERCARPASETIDACRARASRAR
jgi:hypothetical protein